MRENEDIISSISKAISRLVEKGTDETGCEAKSRRVSGDFGHFLTIPETTDQQAMCRWLVPPLQILERSQSEEH
jgi:hypothetical protein